MPLFVAALLRRLSVLNTSVRPDFLSYDASKRLKITLVRKIRLTSVVESLACERQHIFLEHHNELEQTGVVLSSGKLALHECSTLSFHDGLVRPFTPAK